MDNLKIKELLENKRFEVLMKAGEGAIGEVFIANDKITQTKCALKVSHFFSELIKKAFTKELNGYKFFSHPNILKFISSHSFTSSIGEFGVIALERMDTDLFDHVSKNGILNENQSRKIFREICKGIEYLHSMNIFHLDLKPENILIRYGENEEISDVKICDFGFTSAKEIQMNVNYGTKEYHPIEGLLRLLDVTIDEELLYPILSEKSDIWSLGVILFIIMTGLHPFIINDNKIIKIDLNIIKSITKNEFCYSLLEMIFNENPCERPSIKDILNHPWMNEEEAEPIQLIKESEQKAFEEVQFVPPSVPSTAIPSLFDMEGFQLEIEAIEENILLDQSPRVGKKRKFFEGFKNNVINNVKRFFT